MNELIGKKVFYLEPIDGIDQYVDQFKLYRESGCDLTIGPYVSETEKVYSKDELIEIGNTYDAVFADGRRILRIVKKPELPCERYRRSGF